MAFKKAKLENQNGVGAVGAIGAAGSRFSDSVSKTKIGLATYSDHSEVNLMNSKRELVGDSN